MIERAFYSLGYLYAIETQLIEFGGNISLRYLVLEKGK